MMRRTTEFQFVMNRNFVNLSSTRILNNITKLAATIVGIQEPTSAYIKEIIFSQLNCIAMR